jgi:cathepsin L
MLGSAILASAVFGLPFDHEFNTAELSQENMHAMFQAWRFAHSKVYATIEEEMKRFSIWQFNMERIAASNDVYRNGERTYTLRMNSFGDMTDEEFHDAYHCVTSQKDASDVRMGADDADNQRHGRNLMSMPGEDGKGVMPEGATVDWVAKGKVTPVKNQGQCGSCWSFSATGAMECDYAIAHGGSPISLSEQQLVDCSGSYGNQGCNGGWYYDAWKYAEAEGGLCTESAYPYTARDGTCKASSCGTKYYAPSGYTEVTADSESSLQSAVDQRCVSVAIEADQFSFQYYSGGVLTGSCGTRIDHAVLAVGYGTLSGQDYWYVKNSWGTGWGVNGYVYICKDCNANGSRGECGINMDPYWPKE